MDADQRVILVDEKGLRLGEIALASSASSIVRRFPVAPRSGWFGGADAPPAEGVLMYAGVPVEGDAPLAALLDNEVVRGEKDCCLAGRRRSRATFFCQKDVVVRTDGGGHEML